MRSTRIFVKTIQSCVWWWFWWLVVRMGPGTLILQNQDSIPCSVWLKGFEVRLGSWEGLYLLPKFSNKNDSKNFFLNWKHHWSDLFSGPHSYHHTICCFTIKMKPWVNWIRRRVILKEVEMGKEKFTSLGILNCCSQPQGRERLLTERYMVSFPWTGHSVPQSKKSLASFLKQWK